MNGHVAIAKHVKSGRWVVVEQFTSNVDPAQYLKEMQRKAKAPGASHTDFEILQGNWQTAKEACRNRNKE